MLRRPGTQASTAHPVWRTALLLAVILLAFGLRVFRLDFQSLWVDEATSAYLATLSPVQIILNRANGLHPPTYFLALAGWAALAGHSEFSLRFFSVWTGLLLVPLLYRVSRRLFGDPLTGLVAAFLAALSPALVVYSQETRMYAGLPLAYLATLAYALAPKGLRTWRDWLCLAGSELACLYWHSFSVFIVLAVNLLLLATRMRRASRHTWRRWATSQALVGSLYAIWPLVVWRWGAEVPGKLSRRDWRATGLGLSRFLCKLWEFLNSGLLDAGQADDWMGILGTVLLVALLLALLFDRRRRMLMAMIGAFVIPLMGTYPVWLMRPLAHPRYLLFLLTPLLAASARALVVLGRRRIVWIASAALIGVILTSDTTALRVAFFDPRSFRFDMRALAAEIADRAAPGEAALLPRGDYSLWYYDPAPAELASLPGQTGAEGGQLRPQELEPLLSGCPGAFLVTYRDLRPVDPLEQLPFLLEANGHLIERFSVDRMDVAHYMLEGWTLPEPTPMEVECEPLALTGIYSQTTAAADNAVTVALRWHLTQPTKDDHKVTVRLWDGEKQLATTDVQLLNSLGRPTSRWEAGEETSNYYVLPIPLGTPPLTYSLSVAVYEGSNRSRLTWEAGEKWFALGPVQLLQSVNQMADPYGSWGGTEWRGPVISEVAPGLLLEGYAVRPDALKPGDAVYVTLRWRAARDDLPHYTPDLLLSHGEAVLARDAGSLFKRYSTEQWAAGELLIETRQFLMPPSLDPLQLALVVDGQTVSVGEIAVAREALLWQLPATAQPVCGVLDDVAELMGYEWTFNSEQQNRGTLTLYWHATSDAPVATSYTVFAHLMTPEGALLAQHDGLPEESRRPTTNWLPGEVIADRHVLSLDVPHAGPARLMVGMYNLATMTRVPAYNCADGRFPSDAIPVVEFSIGETP